MNKKRMLICGATGFIGRNLLEKYANDERYEVRAVYHHREPLKQYNVDWMLADLNNPEDVKLCVKDMDIVLQFAATTSGAGDIVSRPYIHVTDNAVMNSLILRECYEQNVKHFVFPSCTVMYQPSEESLKETDFDGNQPLLPNYFGVGNTKVYIEKMCDFYSRLGRTKHTVLRHSNIYGPHDKYDLKRSHVFGATVTKVLTAEDKVTVWGTGEEKRDLLYVNDLLDFIESVLQNQKSSYELYNVGYGSAISIKDLVSKIIDVSGKQLELEYDLSKPTIKTNVHLDCTKALNELKWSAKTSLEDGIRLTIEWYRKNIL